MSDLSRQYPPGEEIARQYPPGDELALGGQTGGQPEVSGTEKATIENADLAHA